MIWPFWAQAHPEQTHTAARLSISEANLFIDFAFTYTLGRHHLVPIHPGNEGADFAAYDQAKKRASAASQPPLPRLCGRGYVSLSIWYYDIVCVICFVYLFGTGARSCGAPWCWWQRYTIRPESDAGDTCTHTRKFGTRIVGPMKQQGKGSHCEHGQFVNGQIWEFNEWFMIIFLLFFLLFIDENSVDWAILMIGFIIYSVDLTHLQDTRET